MMGTTIDPERGGYRASILAQNERGGSLFLTRHRSVASAVRYMRQVRGLAVYESDYLTLRVRPHGMTYKEADRLLSQA